MINLPAANSAGTTIPQFAHWTTDKAVFSRNGWMFTCLYRFIFAYRFTRCYFFVLLQRTLHNMEWGETQKLFFRWTHEYMLIYEFSTPVETVLNLTSFTKICAYFTRCYFFVLFLHYIIGWGWCVVAFAEISHTQQVIFRCNKVRYNVKHNASVLFCGHLSLTNIWEVQQLPSLPLLGLAFGS